MADLHISKETIFELFGNSNMQGKKFIIPDYQRPYKWDIEKCETLWNDIENFAKTEPEANDVYFLGTIVSYENSQKNPEIIDGQQRITSFMLLLRAFYKKLENMQEDDHVIGLKSQIAPCLWDIDKISRRVTDFSKIRIVSEVATENDKSIFHSILETGDINENNKDNYTLNYKFFKDKCDSYALQNPLKWKSLCITILHNCIIFPIECESQDTALTIFSTLNDRGLPLADSDIFKAKLYENVSETNRKEFTDSWKELTQICQSGDLEIDDIFRYYTHVLRAKDGDVSREIGLRRFYAENNYQRLKDNKLIDDIIDLAIFWKYINTNKEHEKLNNTLSFNIRKYLQCLKFYTNDYWKYIVSVFFIVNKDKFIKDKDCNYIESSNINKDLNEKFEVLLKKLVSYFLMKFIDKPSVNAVKDDTFSFCVSVYKGSDLEAKLLVDDYDTFCSNVDKNSTKISRSLLLLWAYLNKEQKDLIPDNFDIEHIFPKKWQDTNYNGWDKKYAEDYLEKFGNKIVFEKKLNIQAGNSYFGKKKYEYAKSKIADVLELSKKDENDWTKKDIKERDQKFKEDIFAFFNEALSI